MNRKFFVLLPALMLAFLITSFALAQSGGLYDLSWNTIDAGGATFSTGGIYSLGGTAAQPEAGSMSGGNYALAGGFWQGQSAPTAISLASFAAKAGVNKVKLQWRTYSELETKGYIVWRSAKGKKGEYSRVSAELIPPKNPGAFLPTRHTYSDSPGSGKFFYKLEVDKWSGSEWSRPVRVNVDSGSGCAAGLAKPLLTAPKNAAEVNRTRVTLKWQSVECATHYRVVVRRNSEKGPVVVNERAVTGIKFKTDTLERGKTYYWQARACSANGCKKSPWESFVVREK